MVTKRFTFKYRIWTSVAHRVKLRNLGHEQSSWQRSYFKIGQRKMSEYF